MVGPISTPRILRSGMRSIKRNLNKPVSDTAVWAGCFRKIKYPTFAKAKKHLKQTRYRNSLKSLETYHKPLDENDGLCVYLCIYDPAEPHYHIGHDRYSDKS